MPPPGPQSHENKFDVIFLQETVGKTQNKKDRAAIDWAVYGSSEAFVIGRDATIRHKHFSPLDPVSLKKLQAEIYKAVQG